MKTIGNLLWNILFLGFMTAASTWLLGALLTLTVVAAPIGLGLMQLGILLFWPFGNTMVSRSELIDGKEQNVLWKTYSIVIAIIYFPFGLILAFFALIQAVCLCFTIVGIPVALVVFKSLSTFLNPVNKIRVPKL